MSPPKRDMKTYVAGAQIAFAVMSAEEAFAPPAFKQEADIQDYKPYLTAQPRSSQARCPLSQTEAYATLAT